VLDPKVFKAYDVRGIYPEELDEAGAYAIGRAYVEEFEPRTIAVGRDMRLSSPSMADAAMRGATEAGANVSDLGLVGTEMLYFAVGELQLEGGIAVTASHNPKEYTGMKIVRRGALPVGGDSGLLEIRTRAMSGASHETGPAGTIEQVDMGDGTVLRGVPFTATAKADSLLLTLGTSALPAATLTAGSITIE
jgi:phosphomannomutase